MKTKAILFDLDNTLIDFIRMKEKSCEAAIDAMISKGLKMKKQDALKELYKIYYKVGLEDKEIFQRFLKKVNGKIDYKLIGYGIVAYRKNRINYIKPYRGVKSLLNTLRKKNCKTAIVSDAPRVKAWIRLATMEIEDYFDVIVTKEDTGKTKPSKMPFMKAIKTLGVKPEECLMVGDRPKKDIIGAQKLGMKTAFASYGYNGEDGIPDYIRPDYFLKNVSDLTRLVKNFK